MGKLTAQNAMENVVERESYFAHDAEFLIEEIRHFRHVIWKHILFADAVNAEKVIEVCKNAVKEFTVLLTFPAHN